MTLMLYAHSFSSYCQKVLIAIEDRDCEWVVTALARNPERTAEIATFRL